MRPGEHPFDVLARSVGRPISRRRAIGVIGSTLAVTALGTFPESAAACADLMGQGFVVPSCSDCCPQDVCCASSQGPRCYSAGTTCCPSDGQIGGAYPGGGCGGGAICCHQFCCAADATCCDFPSTTAPGGVGSRCCTTLERCTHQPASPCAPLCTAGTTECGVGCCNAGETCCDPSRGICCPADHPCDPSTNTCNPCSGDQSRCGVGCCDSGATCCDPSVGRCCPAGHDCDQKSKMCSQCSQGETVCGSRCCHNGATCCDDAAGLCCPPEHPCDPTTKTCAACPGGQQACGSACCPSGESCCDPHSGTCCPSGGTCCFGADGSGTCCGPGTTCVGSSPDPNNSGYANHVCCPSDQACEHECCGPGRTCIQDVHGNGVICCAAEAACGGGCCTSLPSFHSVCVNGMCCGPREQGNIVCNGQCVSTANDPNNCGGCGQRCAGTCQNGQCAAAPHQPQAPASNVAQGNNSPPAPVMQVPADIAPDASGEVPLGVSCPSTGTCAGNLTLKTAGAISASSARRDSEAASAVGTSQFVEALSAVRRLRQMVLGSTRFSVPGGQSRVVKVRMSKKSQALLRKHRKLRVVAVIQSGATRTTSRAFTLHAPAARRHNRRRGH